MVKKIKQQYITLENIKSKSQKWLQDIIDYAKCRARFKLKPAFSALLVIDMQNFFLSEDSHAFIPASEAIIPNVKKLVEAYRKFQYPIIFTRHSLAEGELAGIMGMWWQDIIKEGDDFSKIVASLNPQQIELVIRKNKYSPFYSTGLEQILKDRSIKSIVLTGVMTHLCCETAARDAFVRDLEVYFVIDATATINEELHLSSLRTLAHGFAVPVLTEEILKALGEYS